MGPKKIAGRAATRRTLRTDQKSDYAKTVASRSPKRDSPEKSDRGSTSKRGRSAMTPVSKSKGTGSKTRRVLQFPDSDSEGSRRSSDSDASKPSSDIGIVTAVSTTPRRGRNVSQKSVDGPPSKIGRRLRVPQKSDGDGGSPSKRLRIPASKSAKGTGSNTRRVSLDSESDNATPGQSVDPRPPAPGSSSDSGDTGSEYSVGSLSLNGSGSESESSSDEKSKKKTSGDNEQLKGMRRTAQKKFSQVTKDQLMTMRKELRKIKAEKKMWKFAEMAPLTVVFLRELLRV